MGLAGIDPRLMNADIGPASLLTGLIMLPSTVAVEVLNIFRAGNTLETVAPNSSVGAQCKVIDAGTTPTSGQLASFERVFQSRGINGLEKSRQSFENLIKEHAYKIEQAQKSGGYTSSMEREIRNFRQQINAIDQIILRHGK